MRTLIPSKKQRTTEQKNPTRQPQAMERELVAEAHELERNPRREKTRAKTRKRTMRKKSERMMRKPQALELEQAKEQQALELEQAKEQQALELEQPKEQQALEQEPRRIDKRAFPRQERRPRRQNGSPPRHENSPRKRSTRGHRLFGWKLHHQERARHLGAGLSC